MRILCLFLLSGLLALGANAQDAQPLSRVLQEMRGHLTSIDQFGPGKGITDPFGDPLPPKWFKKFSTRGSRHYNYWASTQTTRSLTASNLKASELEIYNPWDVAPIPVVIETFTAKGMPVGKYLLRVPPMDSVSFGLMDLDDSVSFVEFTAGWAFEVSTTNHWTKKNGALRVEAPTEFDTLDTTEENAASTCLNTSIKDGLILNMLNGGAELVYLKALGLSFDQSFPFPGDFQFIQCYWPNPDTLYHEQHLNNFDPFPGNDDSFFTTSCSQSGRNTLHFTHSTEEPKVHGWSNILGAFSNPGSDGQIKCYLGCGAFGDWRWFVFD